MKVLKERGKDKVKVKFEGVEQGNACDGGY